MNNMTLTSNGMMMQEGKILASDVNVKLTPTADMVDISFYDKHGVYNTNRYSSDAFKFMNEKNENGIATPYGMLAKTQEWYLFWNN